jgi:hypothetical protein
MPWSECGIVLIVDSISRKAPQPTSSRTKGSVIQDDLVNVKAVRKPAICQDQN